MSNYSIRLNLLKVPGAGTINLQGKTAVKRCLVIPLDESEMFEGEKGLYLDLQAIELREQKYDQTHMVKIQVSSETYKKMTEQERKNTPIVGSMKEFIKKQEPKHDNDLPDGDYAATQDLQF